MGKLGASLMASSERILYLLKTRGPQRSQQLAPLLQLTSMGVRKHLLTLAAQGLVEAQASANTQTQASAEPVAAKVGRPQQYWQLTAAGHQYFPDRHADVSLQLIDGVRQLFGEAGLTQLIAQRELAQLQLYQQLLADCGDLAAKVGKLAAIRLEEGYLAEVFRRDGCWYLAEHHCPICAAASQCQQFCRSELALFQACVSGWATVERTEHLLAAGSRCVYRFTPL
jgi:predicted ArsR family transcriptional regulator